jgi:hypothetical protein
MVVFRKGQGWFAPEDLAVMRSALAARERARALGEEPIPWEEARKILLASLEPGFKS